MLGRSTKTRVSGAPAVTFDNRNAVYDFYREHRPDLLRAKLSCAVMSHRFRPRVTYADGARAELAQLIRADARLIISINHLTTQDPYLLAGLAWRSVFRPRIGRIRVLAKDELFNDPQHRTRIDAMGGIPVFRGKDHGIRAAHAAGMQMIDTCVYRLASGDDLAIFPEGTCNETDPSRVQPIGTGIGHVLARARDAGIAPTLVCIGLSYGLDTADVKSASFYLDSPCTNLPNRPTEISRMASARMQQALDGALLSY
nr:1-acyl-sn-glycerol-3-phosphate acyltransferase [Nocardia abscessus]